MASEAPSWADNGVRVVLVQWRRMALDPKKTSARTRIRVLRAVLPDSKATAMIGVHKIKSGASICVTWTKKKKSGETTLPNCWDLGGSKSTCNSPNGTTAIAVEFLSIFR